MGIIDNRTSLYEKIGNITLCQSGAEICVT